MAPTNVGYSFKEAISHFFRNWTTSLGAVITIFLSLFIIGLFIMGSAMLNSVIGTVEDQVVINAFISDDADQADVQAFEAELKTWSNVKSVTYKDKDDALAEYTSKMSGNADATMSALDGTAPRHHRRAGRQSGTFRFQLRRRGADGRFALCVRHALRPHRMGCRTSGIRP